MTWIRAEGGLGKPTIYYDEKGPALEVYGPRNRRNNNPGNIEYGSFAKKHGAIGTDGRFAIFPDEETGFRAMKDLLLSNSYKNLTIRDAIKRWAPAPENDPRKYLEFVIQKTGLDENELIKNLTPSQLDALAKAMATKEGYYSRELKIEPLRDDVDPSTFLKNNKDFEEVRSLNDIAPNNPYYIVQPGDTLSKIAKRYGVDLNDLINENRRRGLIEDPNLIYPGQRIYIPGYQEKTRRNVQEGSRRIDPLVIDLDGNGIKLVNINKSNAMFDLTGSGFANKTGWISSGDAFLVWDRNNDNRINDISEMFGSATQSGFQALSLYDTNRDGKIDAFDDVFKNLKLWQDRNGDGRTDEGELLSLSDVGIKAINLNTTKTNINQEGNTITEVGSVEFEDGRKTQAGNVNFELDRLYSYYNREVELNPEIVGLPWVRGYGFMPDLPIAMSLDNTLLQMVKDAVAETDLTKLKEKFEKIVFRWAGVENVTDKEIGVSWAILSGNDREHRLLHFDGGITLSYEQIGALQKFVGMTPEEVADTVRHRSGQYFLEAWNTMFQGLFTRFVVDAGLLEDVLPAYYDFFTDKIMIDEDFKIAPFESQIKQMISSQDLNQINLAFISMMVLKETNLLEPQFIVELYTDFNKNLEALTSPYIGFLFNKIISGTKGDDWLYGTNQNDIIVGDSGNDRIYGYDGDDILIGGAGNDQLYGGDGNDILIGGAGNDYMDGGIGSDTYVFNRGDGQDTIYDPADKEEINTIIFGENITLKDIEFIKDSEWVNGDLIIKIKNSDDSLRIKYWFEQDKYSKFQLKFFDDGTILKKSDIDAIGYKIYGTDEHDKLTGSDYKDTIYGYSGDDYLTGYAGNDTLIGGTGNDILVGGPGSDTYVFNKGDGQDTIYEKKDNNNEINTVLFGEGITKEDLDFVKDGNDLLLKIKGTDDSLRIGNWFIQSEWWQSVSVDYKIDIFKFSDGSMLTKEEIENSGYKVYGNEYNNYLNGSNKNDVIYGYDGDDSLYGDEGDDTLIGGTGNDGLVGGQGSDTYIFNRGDGNDTIYGDNLDTLKFGEGITKEDLEFSRNGNALVIRIKNSDDSITLENWFYSEDSKIGKIEFIDGSILTKEEIDSIIDFFTIKGTDKDDVLYGTEGDDAIIGLAGNDTIHGGDGNDVIYGGDGDDNIYGGSGDDNLIGSSGDDYLEGGSGNDTYIFNKGDGNDTIYINKTDKYRTEWGSWIFTEKAKLVFGDGITKDELDFIKKITI